MYCRQCEARRADEHIFCFCCGTHLIEEHHRENFWAVLDFISHGESEEQLNALKKFVEENPKLPSAHKLLGNALFHKGHLISAESQYRMAMDYDPDNICYVYDLSVVLYYQSRITEALGYLKKVLLLDPKFSAAHYRIGLAYYHLGQFDEAVEHLKKCAELTPDYEMAHFHLGVVYAKMGNEEKAIWEFGHQLDRDLKDAAASTHLDELFANKWKKQSEVVET